MPESKSRVWKKSVFFLRPYALQREFFKRRSSMEPVFYMDEVGPGVLLNLRNKAERVAPLKQAYLATICGPLTWVRFNQLPDGPCIGITYQDLERAVAGR
jgi:hypothetical protein